MSFHGRLMVPLICATILVSASPSWAYDFSHGAARPVVSKPGRVKTYPISRLLTSRLNPFCFFGLNRLINTRGFLGRLKVGHLSPNDRRSFGRMLSGRMLDAEARALAALVVQMGREGEFKSGRKYRFSRFWTSRGVQSVLGGLSVYVSGGGTLAMGTVLKLGALTGGLAAFDTHLGRAITSRALAGRLAKGKKLIKSEKRLVAALEGDAVKLSALEQQ